MSQNTASIALKSRSRPVESLSAVCLPSQPSGVTRIRDVADGDDPAYASAGSNLTGAAMQITLRCCLAGDRAASWRHGGRVCMSDIVSEAMMHRFTR